MSIDAWGKPTPEHMKPLRLTEDRSPEQLSADGDAPVAEPVPCGRIASATHCCEYHAIHSDDDFATALSLLEEAEHSVLKHEWWTRRATLLARLTAAPEGDKS